jgi:hypothetical protein
MQAISKSGEGRIAAMQTKNVFVLQGGWEEWLKSQK